MKVSLSKLVTPLAFVLLWSTGGIVAEYGLVDNSPITFVSLRLALSFSILGIFIIDRKSLYQLTLPVILKAATIGFLLQGCYQYFYFMALDANIAPGMLAIILGTQPIWTLIITRENFTFSRLLILGIGLVGFVSIVFNTLFNNMTNATGMIYSLFALCGITVGTILQKRYNEKISTALNLCLQFLFSAIIFGSFFLISSQTLVLSVPFVLSLAWMAIVISVVASLLYYSLLNKNSATNVTSLFYLVPITTAYLDYLIFGNRLNLETLFGMIIIVISLYLLKRSNQTRSHEMFTKDGI